MTDPARRFRMEFTREEIDAAKRDGRLLSLEVELSRACNLRCIYCYADAGERLADELCLDEICDAADQAIALGARRIIVIGGGEPLLYPHLMDVLRHLRRRGVGIDLFTNGTCLDRETAEALLDLRVAPVVKLNSLREAVQDRLAGVPGTLRAIRRGLDHLLTVGYPHPDCPLGVETVICRHNLDELPALWCWARDQNLIPYFEALTVQGRARANPDLAVSPAELQALFAELSRLDRERYDSVWEPHPPIAGLACNRHEYSCIVTSRGDVSPCPGIDVVVGNVRENPLAEILRESPLVATLRDIRRHLHGACGACELLDRCYGCRGSAYQLTGDFTAADPLCWRTARRAA